MRDASIRKRFVTDPELVMQEYALSKRERRLGAGKSRDIEAPGKYEVSRAEAVLKTR